VPKFRGGTKRAGKATGGGGNKSKRAKVSNSKGGNSSARTANVDGPVGSPPSSPGLTMTSDSMVTNTPLGSSVPNPSVPQPKRPTFGGGGGGGGGKTAISKGASAHGSILSNGGGSVAAAAAAAAAPVKKKRVAKAPPTADELVAMVQKIDALIAKKAKGGKV
jgi:hypothetical protein